MHKRELKTGVRLRIYKLQPSHREILLYTTTRLEWLLDLIIRNILLCEQVRITPWLYTCCFIFILVLLHVYKCYTLLLFFATCFFMAMHVYCTRRAISMHVVNFYSSVNYYFQAKLYAIYIFKLAIYCLKIEYRINFHDYIQQALYTISQRIIN